MFYEMNWCYPSITRGIWDIDLLVVMSFGHQNTLMYFISSLLGDSKYYNLFSVSLSLNIFFQPSGLTQISSPRISSPSLFLSPPWRISDCSRKASMASAKYSCWGKLGDETSSFTCLKNCMWEFWLLNQVFSLALGLKIKYLADVRNKMRKLKAGILREFCSKLHITSQMLEMNWVQMWSCFSRVGTHV